MGGVRERPIVMSGGMVRPTLAGTKTQTRQILKCDLEIVSTASTKDWAEALAANVWFGRSIGEDDIERKAEELRGRLHPFVLANGRMVALQCPFGAPGERLWCKESHWRFTGCELGGHPWPGFVESPDGNPYNARCYDDHADLDAAHSACAVVRVRSILMPRWASRILLEITDVRVQRLQSISEEDARCEGVSFEKGVFHVKGIAGSASDSAVGAFRKAWDSSNGRPRIERDADGREIARHHVGWSADPWVWVVEFRKLHHG